MTVSFSFMFCTPRKWSDEVKKTKKDGARCKYGREERCIQGFGGNI